MREIKFRAWKNGNGFAYDVQNEYDSEPWVYKDGFVNCDCFGSLLNRDEIIIEQFTGLYDKNGKEIYEGDIIDSYDNDSYKYVIKWNDRLASFTCVSDDGHDDEYMHTIVEIIGNIHENPELIE